MKSHFLRQTESIILEIPNEPKRRFNNHMLIALIGIKHIIGTPYWLSKKKKRSRFSSFTYEANTKKPGSIL